MFDSMSFRAAFSSVINSDFVYFDNAATAQKPDCMVKALSDYYGSALGSAGRGQNPPRKRQARLMPPQGEA